MSYNVTKLQLDAVLSNLHMKGTPQTIYVDEKIGLGMRRASKKAPKGSIIVGVYTRGSSPQSVRGKVFSLNSQGTINYSNEV